PVWQNSSPPPCGEGMGVGVVRGAPQCVTHDPHPIPPHKGEGGVCCTGKPYLGRLRGQAYTQAYANALAKLLAKSLPCLTSAPASSPPWSAIPARLPSWTVRCG